MADVPDATTAYSHPSANFSVLAFGASKAPLDAARGGVASHFRGLYLSFETDQSPERISEAGPAPAPARLRSLKKQYDPDNVFRESFNMDPLGD